MGCGTTTIKYILFLFNLIFALGGLALLVVGSIIQWNINNYGELFGQNFAAPSILLIIVGCVIFVISFFGCCGAIQESHCMIITYSILVLLVLIAQVTGGVLALVYRDQIDSVIEKEMRRLLTYYNGQGTEAELATQLWDNLQKDLQCCGVDGPNDWIGVTPLPPQSCACSSTHGECLAGMYQKGCYPKLKELVHTLGTVIGAIAIGIAVIELISVIFACTLASSFKRKHMIM